MLQRYSPRTTEAAELAVDGDAAATPGSSLSFGWQFRLEMTTGSFLGLGLLESWEKALQLFCLELRMTWKVQKWRLKYQALGASSRWSNNS
jgi:hypothetical protein